MDTQDWENFLTKDQKRILIMYKIRSDDELYKNFIKNRIQPNQVEILQCICCKKEWSLTDSEDYIGALLQWERYGYKCYACGRGLGTNKSFPCHIR